MDRKLPVTKLKKWRFIFLTRFFNTFLTRIFLTFLTRNLLKEIRNNLDNSGNHFETLKRISELKKNLKLLRSFQQNIINFCSFKKNIFSNFRSLVFFQNCLIYGYAISITQTFWKTVAPGLL